MKRLFLLSFSLIVLGNDVFAQEDYDDEHIESSLPNFSRFHTNTEYYQFNTNEQAIYLLANGTIEFGNSDYLNFELPGARYVKENTSGYTLGDVNLSYTKNFYFKEFLNPGFQGISPTIKLILPTGNSDYSGLFGYLIFEPAIYYSWLLKNDRFFISNRWRLFLPVINVQEASEPPQYIRFEPRFGFENNKLWISITLDNRFIYNLNEYVLYFRGDFGYKLNEKSGISVFYTKRINNTVLFDTYASIGYYYIFQK